LNEDTFEGLLTQATEISRQIAGFMRYLASSNNNGNKFKTIPEEEAIWIFNEHDN